MKKTFALAACCGLIFLGACGDDNQVTNPPDNAAVENNNQTNNNASNTNNSSNQQNNNITFSSFDLDVEYDHFKSFEVEYENEHDGMEAKIKDEINNRKISGDEAFQELKSRFEQFKFNSTTSEEEVINEVLQSFELNNNFKEFELEVQFADGTEKEYILVK